MLDTLEMHFQETRMQPLSLFLFSFFFFNEIHEMLLIEMEEFLTLRPVIWRFWLCFGLCLLQSDRVVSELLQRLHAADRHGVQHLLPAVLWPSCKRNCKLIAFTLESMLVEIVSVTCDHFLLFFLNSLLLPMTSCGSGWRWTRWWTSSRFLRCLCRSTWTGAGSVRMLKLTKTKSAQTTETWT